MIKKERTFEGERDGGVIELNLKLSLTNFSFRLEVLEELTPRHVGLRTGDSTVLGGGEVYH